MVFRSMLKRNRERITISNSKNDDDAPKLNLKISSNMQTNIDNLNNLLDKPDDLKIRTLTFGETNIKGAFAFIDGIVDSQSVHQSVISNLEYAKDYPKENKEIFNTIFEQYIAINDVKTIDNFDDLSLSILSGLTILFIDGVNQALTINTIGGEQRAIEEPVTETLIRGPRSGFVENIQTNLALIRRRVKDHNLRLKTYITGRRGNNAVVLAYIDGIIHPEILKEVDRRLQTIDIDIIPESGYIEEWIEDSFLSPFPQILNTERPDKAVTAIMQGKFAIFVDGTPFVLIAPINFSNILQSPEDYYERWSYGSLLRLLRYFAAFVSIFFVALYIALIGLNPGLLPTQLAFSIAGAREGVPFPPVAEALLMVVTLELLTEAGARLPQTIGQTIGIVGGLVIGEAAVQAGIVSPIMVIIIAITAIANFAIASYSLAISFRIIRFGFIFAAGVFGLYGIILVYIMINIHLVNLKSFGVPYLSSFAPFFPNDWNDIILRSPLTTFRRRPSFLKTIDDISADNKGEN